MFYAATLRLYLRRVAIPNARNASTVGPARTTGGIPPTVLSSWYSMFGSSAATYGSWLVAGILLAEGVTGYGTEMVWNSINYQRTYDSIDWSQFAEKDDEDEDEDDDDDDDEEEEDEEGDDDEDDDDDDEE